MKEFVHLYKHPGVDMFNYDFLTGADDYSIEELVTICMKELEAISNITIESVETIYDMDEIDINEHKVNKNYKKKNDDLDIPKFKYMSDDVYAEMRFGVRIKTNLNEKFIIKKILIPVNVDGYYIFKNKRAKAIWQLTEASVYTQRGKITLKSRMPVILYKSKKRPITDVNGEVFDVRPFSYALHSSKKSRKKTTTTGKNKNKFINPMMIYSAKVGVHDAIKFMGMQRAIRIVQDAVPESSTYIYFPLDEVYIRVNRSMFEDIPMVRSVTGMLYNMNNKNFPVTWEKLCDNNYWISRIGFIGAPKDKQLKSYYEKGRTTILMIERSCDMMTQMNLRLPEAHKENIYCILRWMMFEYDNLRQKDNIDINTKRIRKSEYIVKGSLGRKISENINNLIPKLSESRQNSMDTLLELFNFPSTIIINGLNGNNDCIKTDELVNDMSILQDMAYTVKGPEALGESSTKNVMLKMRDIHPSFIGVIDPNCSSNSDVGMSGIIVPTVKLHDRMFFNPEWEPSDNMYNVAKDLHEHFEKNIVVTDSNLDTEEETSIEVAPTDNAMMNAEAFNTWLKSYDDAMHMEMEPICIVERDPAEIENNAEDKLAKTMKKKLALTEDSSESHDKAPKTTE